jgi:hypothetical protein
MIFQKRVLEWKDLAFQLGWGRDYGWVSSQASFQASQGFPETAMGRQGAVSVQSDLSWSHASARSHHSSSSFKYASSAGPSLFGSTPDSETVRLTRATAETSSFSSRRMILTPCATRPV